MLTPDDPHYPSAEILDKLRDAFPKSFDKVMAELRWDSICGCWLTSVCGMTVGIETDGYIHS